MLILGHTHYPMIRRLKDGGYILNPGSVGQSRDGNPDPSWIILDTGVVAEGERVRLRRVTYDRSEPLAVLKQLGWPARLIRALDKTAAGPLEMDG
jgi:diadenosine tetraphosphatase ApaH/serine/threonine PP2A family protein phosphatase